MRSHSKNQSFYNSTPQHNSSFRGQAFQVVQVDLIHGAGQVIHLDAPAFDRDKEAFAETIRVALRESPAWEAGDAASALTQFHSPQNFRATVQNWFGGEEPVMTWPEAVAVT